MGTVVDQLLIKSDSSPRLSDDTPLERIWPQPDSFKRVDSLESVAIAAQSSAVCTFRERNQ